MAHGAAFGDQSGAVAEFHNGPFAVHPVFALVQKSKGIDAGRRPGSNGMLGVGGFEMPAMHQSQERIRVAALDPKIGTDGRAAVASIRRGNLFAAEAHGVDELDRLADLRRGKIGIRNEKAKDRPPETGI